MYRTPVSFTVDECQSGNGGCDQICEDTLLAFNCQCRNGFALNLDGTSCDGNELFTIN